MMMDKIPILKRRAQQQQSAATSSSKSDDSTNCKSDDKSATSSNCKDVKDPICVIVVGMAGSGKTTLMAQLQKSLNLKARENKEEEDTKKSSSADDNDVSFLMCFYILYCVYVFGLLIPCINIY